MSVDFILPDIGEGIVECEILKWLVKEGDVIKEDQPVAEVMTDKATVEIPAVQNGRVEKLFYSEGEIAKVHQPLFRLENVAPAEIFILPDIGEGIVECEIVRWCVNEQDTVAEDQVVVEVMTDKAIVEIPAKHPGKLVKQYHKEGEVAKVHAPLFELLVSSDDSHQSAASHYSHNEQRENQQDDPHECQLDSQQSAQGVQTSTSGQSDAIRRVTEQIQRSNYIQGENTVPPVKSERPIASPAVRRLAKEKNVDLRHLMGSGAKGRVLKKDVLAAVEKTPARQHQNQTRSEDTRLADALPLTMPAKIEPLNGLRAAMCKHMKESATTIPHFSVSDELEMDALIALRNELKSNVEKDGIRLSFMPFFIKALSMALLQFPIINARVSADEKGIHFIAPHNIGFAVDTAHGLVVPNIKHVQTLSLIQIAQEMHRLIQSAQQGRLQRGDLDDGTITVSNIGMIGGITATPIINKPEVAIVALGKTRKLPRFDDNDNVIAKHIMHVNWSGDHRVIDGATMVKFNNCWMDYLVHPEKMLIELR